MPNKKWQSYPKKGETFFKKIFVFRFKKTLNPQLLLLGFACWMLGTINIVFLPHGGP